MTHTILTIDQRSNLVSRPADGPLLILAHTCTYQPPTQSQQTDTATHSHSSRSHTIHSLQDELNEVACVVATNMEIKINGLTLSKATQRRCWDKNTTSAQVKSHPYLIRGSSIIEAEGPVRTRVSQLLRTCVHYPLMSSCTVKFYVGCPQNLEVPHTPRISMRNTQIQILIKQ